MRRALISALVPALGLGLILAVYAAPAADKEAPVVPPREGKSETIKLFDGKDLDGWEGDKNLWSVQDGEIVGKSKALEGQHLPADQAEFQRLSPSRNGQAGRSRRRTRGFASGADGRRRRATNTPTPAIW